jgi:dihydropteroate synthase
MIWTTRQGPLDLSQQARVMGILNVTPDSFSDGGDYCEITHALHHARKMIEEGATIIDIGGESTRPGALPVPEEEEIRRTAPVVAALRSEWNGRISIDTSKASVAAAAIAAGADIVNDVSGLTADPAMSEICRESGCGIVVMHRQGDPLTMQRAPHYSDVVAEVREYFAERFTTLTKSGIAAEALCFDPGIGFGKTVEHNLALLRALDRLSPDGRPILLGVSRKSFLGKLVGTTDVNDREWPTVAITARAREKGVMLHRVHAVRANREALQMIEAILGNES